MIEKVWKYSVISSGEKIVVNAPQGAIPVNVERDHARVHISMRFKGQSVGQTTKQTFRIYGPGAARPIPHEVSLNDFVGTYRTQMGRVHLFKAAA